MPRAMIYIDKPNQWRRGLDLVKLIERIGAGDEVVGIGLYEEEPGSSTDKLTAYPQVLGQHGFRHVLLPELRRPKRELVDMQLSVDMVADAYENKFDVAILVAGDADYKPAIQKVLTLRKEVRGWAFGAPAQLLRNLIEINSLESIFPTVRLR